MADFTPQCSITRSAHLVNHRFTPLKSLVGSIAITFLLLVPLSVQAATTPAVLEAPVPTLNWTDCGNGFQCATAKVRLDYAYPRGATISLGLIRLPATEQTHRIGSLFTNPGGPGGSGVAFIQQLGKSFPAAWRARFDIIGFDPRGVGESTPVRCFGSVAAQQAFFSAYGLFPVGAKEQQAYLKAYQQLDQQCGERNARILPYLSTANVARDMDLLRRAVGDAKLNYFGISYGTYLGETYANLFPNRFRALILDGVIDPIAYSTGYNDQADWLPSFLRIGSNVGTYQTLKAFLAQCAAVGSAKCAFTAGSAKSTTMKFNNLLQFVLKHPIVLPTKPQPTTITYALLVTFVWESLYSSHGWPRLATTLQLIYHYSGLPTPQVVPQATPYSNGREAQVANNCADTDNPGNPQAYPAIARKADERSPYFGSAWTYVSFPCAGWPAQDASRYVGPWHRPTRNPILLVGVTTDPATPYHDAVSASHILANARLLTLNGWGHTAFLQGSTCVEQYEDAYLIDGKLPLRGATCQPDSPPFGPASQTTLQRQDIMQSLW